MSTKGIKVKVDLDFTSGHIDKEGINKQINSAIEAVKINLDPQSAKEFEKEFQELGKLLQRHLNEATGKINPKGLTAAIDNSESLDMIERLGQRYAAVGVNGQKSFKQISEEADILNKKIITSNGVLDKMGQTLKNTIRWNISTAVVNNVTSAFQEMYYFSKDLDRVLTDIRIVSGHSAENMKEFARSANQASKELGVSTIEYGKAATLFFQQGLGDQGVKNMTEAAVVASRVTGVATDEMSNLLTATINGFQMATDEAYKVTDAMAAIGASTASSFEEIAVGSSKVASMAKSAGFEAEELFAQIATIVATTRQAPESVGTALRTIYGRMLAFKVDTKALMEDDDGELFSAPDVEKALQAYSRVAGAQISLFETNAEGQKVVKDTSKVLDEIGETWDSVTDKQAKFALTTALAGSRQQNNMIALLDNYKEYKDTLEIAMNSEGETLKQNAIYMESYEAKVKGLQAAKEELFMVLTDSDSMKGFIEGVTASVEGFTKLVDLAGGFNFIIGGIATLFSTQIVKEVENVSKTFAMLKDKMGAGGSGEELEQYRQLSAISKVYGEEVAKTLRNEIRREKVSIRVLAAESENLSKQRNLYLDIQEIQTSQATAQEKNLALEQALKEARESKVPLGRATELKEKYDELVLAQERMLSAQEKMANGNASGAIEQTVTAAENEVARLENDIENIFQMTEAAHEQAVLAKQTTERNLKESTTQMEELAKPAEKTLEHAKLLNIVMMGLPAAINKGRDSSNSLLDVMKSIAVSVAPTLVTTLWGMLPAIKAATEGMTVLAGIQTAMSMTSPYLLAAAGIAALGGVIWKVTQDANEASDAFRNLSESTSKLQEVENNYEAIDYELESIKEHLKEIQEKKDSGMFEGEDLENLEKIEEKNKERLQDLEDEKMFQELILADLKERAEEEARIAAISKLRSEEASMQADGSIGFEELDRNQKLEEYMRLHDETAEKIKKHERALQELEVATASNVFEEIKHNREISKKTKELESLRKKQSEYKTGAIELAQENHQIAKSLDDTEESTRTLKEGLEEVFDQFREWSGVTPEPEVETLTEVIDENTESIYDNIEAFREGKEELEGETLKNVIEEHELFGDVMRALQGDGDMTVEMYERLIAISDDYLDIMDMEVEAAVAVLGASKDKREAVIEAAIDSKETAIENIEQEIKAYGMQIEAMQEVAKAASALWGKSGLGGIDHKSRQQAIIDNQTLSKDEATKLLNASKAMEDYSKALDLTEQKKELQASKTRLEIQLANLRKVDDSKNKAAAKRREAAKKKDKKKSTKSAKKKKEEYKAEADAYALLNVLLKRNNALIAANESERARLDTTARRYLSSLNKEMELKKQRQKLLNEYNQELRAEGKTLQKSLSKTFNFEGSWDDNSMIITNMDAIEGKSKKVEEQFKRVVQIMEELPNASNEWKKLRVEIEALDIQKLQWEFDDINRSLSSFDQEIERINRNLRKEGPEDFEKQVHALNLTILAMDSKVKLAERAIKEFNEKALKEGTRYTQEFKESQNALKDSFEESQVVLVEYQRSLEELIKTEKDRYTDKILKQKNEELQKHRDQISAIEQVQEAIVNIIRKRGEEENRILDENYHKALKRLEDEEKANKQANQENLDDYRKLINDKIAALENSYAEEDYREQLLKEQEEATRLQKELDILSLDDSLNAKNKRKALREELSKQIEKIEKMEQKRSRDSIKKALQEELKDYEDSIKKKETLSDESTEKTKERLKEEYEEQKKYLEEQYSNANIYAEAADALMKGRVLTAKGVYQDIASAQREFEEEFGVGMGLLGEIIHKDFLEPLREAEEGLKTLGRLSNRPRKDYTAEEITDKDRYEAGYRDPKPQSSNRPKDFVSPTYWTDRDYNEYINNKELWKSASKQERERLNERNRQLRRKYWGPGRENEDRYTLKDLQGYKSGGVLSETGVFLGHGSEQSSEVIFSAKTAKKLWDYVENLPEQKHSPQMPRLSKPLSQPNMFHSSYEVNFNIEGNMDKSLLPEVKKIIKNEIDKNEFTKKKELNKIGQFRSL